MESVVIHEKARMRTMNMSLVACSRSTQKKRVKKIEKPRQRQRERERQSETERDRKRQKYKEEALNLINLHLN